MARKSRAQREQEVRIFIYVSASVLVLGLSLLLFLSSVDLFSFRSKSALEREAAPAQRSSGFELLSIVHHFRNQSGVAAVFCDLKGSPPEIFIRLDASVSNGDFIAGLGRVLRLKKADLVSSGFERNSDYPVRVVVDLNSIPLVIYAGWNQRQRSPAVRRKRSIRVVAGAQKQPRIAIVLDDAGDRNPSQWRFLTLKTQLTFAVMPDLEYSVRFAQRAKQRGFEVILHAPMEPFERRGMRMPAAMIRTGMSTGGIRNMLDGFLRSVPGAVGLNNHMGSKATADSSLMRKLMVAVREKGLFFLDSRTHSSSRAFSAAREGGVTALQRDVFLDHKRGYSYIQNRLVELARIAAGKGYAIGIGHVTHQNMYSVLRSMIPELRKTGFRFVCLSELFRKE